MQPHKDHTAENKGSTYKTPDGESVVFQPPRYVHHDATMFKPIADNDPAATQQQQLQQSTSSGTSKQQHQQLHQQTGFLSDNSKRRKVEELQRTIEFTDRLQRDADNTVFASKIAIGMETMCFGLCAFLANIGLRHSNPQQSVLRRFADTNIRLARVGSFYSIIGVTGMMMSLSYVPMEWQAIENARMSVQKLADTQARAIKERNAMLEDMAKAVGIAEVPPLD